MRRRILMAILSTAIVAIAALVLPLAVRLERDARSEATGRLEKAAAAEVTRLPPSLQAPSLPIVIPDIPYDGDLTIYNSNGERVGGEGSDTIDPLARAALAGRTAQGRTGDRLAVAIPVVRGLKVVAAIEAAEPISVSDRSVRRQRINIAAFAGLAMLASLIVGLTVSSAIAKPLRRLGQDATRIGNGDFTARAHRSGIREVDEVATALDDTAVRLGTILERERAFSANASHQLRTPLTSLRLAIETELAAPRPDQSTLLAELLDETDRLETTISELLSLAREPNEPTIIDIAGVMREVEARWHGRFAAAGRPLRTAIEPNIAPVHSSASAIGQIVDVLCDNALCHGQGVVTVSARNGRGGGCVLTVSDEGNGMDHDPFAAAAIATNFNSGSSNGHGLGLGIAHALSTAHHAHVRLTNTGPYPKFELILQ